MRNKIIFISHIVQEKDIAIALKHFLENKFTGGFDVFVSSHEDGLKLGEEWFTTIKNSIYNCDLLLVLCSPLSITRPWINFEAGAGWAQNKAVIPLCHSGLTPGELLPPLNSIQAGELNNAETIERLINRIAEIFGTRRPTFDNREFLDSIRPLEQKIINSLLRKDVLFIYNYMYLKIHRLTMYVIGSVTKFEDLNRFIQQEWKLDGCIFEFADLENIFNVPIEPEHECQYVWEAYYKTSQELVEKIKFLLSYQGLTISATLKTIFNQLVVTISTMEIWYSYMKSTHHPRNKNIIKMEIDLIKSGQPKYSQGNIRNHFVNYYNSLVEIKSLILNYKKEIRNITGGY